MTDRQMPHRIAAIRLKPEALGDLARQQIASHVFTTRRDDDVTRLEWRQPIRVDMGENAGGGTKLQKRNVFALGDGAGELRLHLDDVRVGEPANYINIVNRKVDHHPYVRHARWKRSYAGDRNREDILATDRFLDRFDCGIETFDMANHQGHAGPARRVDDVAALFHRRGDRLFHHDVDTSRNAKERDIAMQMSGCRNGDRVDIAVEQFFDIGDGNAAQGARHKFSLLAVWIGDTNQFRARQSREHAGMIAAHNTDANNPHTQRTLRACYCGLHHLSTVSPRPITSALLSPSMAMCGWRPPLGSQSEHVLIHSVTIANAFPLGLVYP